MIAQPSRSLINQNITQILCSVVPLNLSLLTGFENHFKVSQSL
jgi:hypothetical protein